MSAIIKRDCPVEGGMEGFISFEVDQIFAEGHPVSVDAYLCFKSCMCPLSLAKLADLAASACEEFAAHLEELKERELA